MQLQDGVWVFCGPKAAFPSGVFATRELAEAWINRVAQLREIYVATSL